MQAIVRHAVAKEDDYGTGRVVASSRCLGSLVVFVSAISLLGISAPAIADQAENLHVLRIFSEGTTTAGFFPVEDITPVCPWNLMYVDLASPAGRGQLALLMQAKAQGLRLSRIDYTRNGNACTVQGIHIE